MSKLRIPSGQLRRLVLIGLMCRLEQSGARAAVDTTFPSLSIFYRGVRPPAQPAQPGRESDSTPGTFQTAGVVHSVGTCAGPDTIQLVGGASRYIFFQIEIFLCTLLLLFCRHITCSFVQLGRGQTCDKSHSVSSKHFWSWWFCRTCHMKTVIRPCGSQCGSDCWFCWQMF